MMDWIFSRQIRGGAGVPDPIFSFGMEILPPPDSHIGLEFNLMRPDPLTEYPKSEREIFLAVHAYLKYIAAWWPPRSGSSTCPCFIATAAFGSPYHRHVQFLRDLRDRVFPSTAFGAQFIHAIEGLYYSFSPAVASYLEGHEAARQLTRVGFLSPLVAWLRIVQRFAARFRRPEAQVGILVGAVIATFLAMASAAGGLIALVLRLLINR
jgi:hypothetical protein